MPFPYPEGMPYTEAFEASFQYLKKTLETNAYDVLIGHCQGAIVVYMILVMIQNKMINCRMPSTVILSSMTFDLNKYMQEQGLDPNPPLNIRSIHLFGEDDPDKEACFINTKLFKNAMAI